MDRTIEILLIIWGAVTIVLVIMFIYRSTLTMKEEDALFLDRAEDHMRKEQIKIVAKIEKMDRLVWIVGILSAVLLLVLAGVWIYHGLTRQFT